MVVFKFALPKVSSKSRPKTTTNKVVIADKVQGVVVIDENGKYFVISNGEKYNLTYDSYNTKGKRKVWLRTLDKYQHKVCIIRDGKDAIPLKREFYVPFAPGHIVYGQIVKFDSVGKQFKIIRCTDIIYPDTVEIYDNMRKFNDKVKKGEIVLNGVGT